MKTDLSQFINEESYTVKRSLVHKGKVAKPNHVFLIVQGKCGGYRAWNHYQIPTGLAPNVEASLGVYLWLKVVESGKLRDLTEEEKLILKCDGKI